MAQLLLLNGPNLNLLGRREPARYGRVSLDQIVSRLTERAQHAGHVLEAFQSNAEGEMIDRVQQTLGDGTDFILINPGALTHTSIGLRDALLAVDRPFIEIHLTNIHAREPFRRHSYLSDVAVGVICGLGDVGYDLALEAALRSLSS
ncbi:type II 3-dehydroquinate dehydratase [Candidatus Macondimonas diazotrophica]|jgi:3-dehydroquinate dehydratase-2|uniref:3-dehydroquinate dehydratase n=1 Tax=Candidatus Macondimonas diazotrophica TaxID=2305248 RepID=A0A4Z0FC99_9GAMM|nr:type II 3-dehydroquinate dehydratase [Candidatus Macondimonas diazotrophica]MDY6955683.1 type II 3-dehydroquinate dehydratase [Pseudomonadota bacterium]HBG29155.1 type II 3-dehydroquinate dehydratase [Gammaproteobacteria bacterium]NCU00568.1 type II 3-dehydroquinate dehydratase [Candidatus Macondimonas diazotrophica]TFZ84148.1 type II 3-dehydroquinate dehydratase [Candidatus Macondimonas diazotrophica]HBG51043.1 type II 3-dehydroquinate dehydratase [Gammaproteobacteria bacterium]